MRIEDDPIEIDQPAERRHARVGLGIARESLLDAAFTRGRFYTADVSGGVSDLGRTRPVLDAKPRGDWDDADRA